jgi:diguanylate cyclase (GGDEF) domain
MDDLIDHYQDIHYFYAVRPLNTEKTGNVMSVLSAERYYDRYVDTEGNLFLGWISDDEYDSNTAAKLFEIMNGNDIVFFEETTEWGTDYTGAVPIKDSDGNGFAVLAVDIDISFIRETITSYAAVNFCVIMLLGIVFIGVFLLWSQENITKPIKKLEESAVGFVDHSSRQRDVDALNFEAPELKTNNEIKSLSDAVVKMTEDMRDYVSDIISAEEKAANMQELANRDALTGIRNKTAYDAAIAGIQDTKVGLAVVDLNNLKKLNDTYGHDKGDLAIKALSKLICEVFCHSPVFRIGGDEFVVILRGQDYDNYDQLLASFNERLKEMDGSHEPWKRISAAIGAAFFEDGDDMNSLFKRADQMMYKRKKEMKAGREQ